VPTTRERYDEMIKTELGVELRTLGFKRRRNAFFRKTDQGWTLVDFQASQFGTREEVSFTINLGVSFVELQADEGGAPSLGRALIRERIGRLLDASGDIWWNLDPDSDVAAVATTINDAVTREAIPWLDARASLAQLLSAARADPNFIESWHLSRLSVLATDANRLALALAEELRHLSQQRP